VIFCYDIDGTLCTNTDGGYELAEPFPEMIAELNRRHAEGHRIVLFTARGSTTGIDWRSVTENQLEKWGVKYHELLLGKPHADVYIDDKAYNPWNPLPPALRQTESKTAPGGASSALKNASYLDVTYAPDKAPRTSYPGQLAQWLVDTAYRGKGRLLDVGCGRGEYLEAFHQAGMNVAGVDISPAAPRYAAPHHVEVIDFESGKLPFPEGSFDFLFSKSVIEHIREPASLLGEVHRVLKPGGTAVIMTPSWEYTYWGPFYIDHTHVTPFTKMSLDEILTMSGFQTPAVSYFRQLPFLWKNPALNWVARVISALPIPYRPIHAAPWPDELNKLIRFSKEVMLLAIARKAPARTS